MMRACLGTILFLLAFNSIAMAGEILDQIPSDPDKESRYVFYSHGFIVEGDDPRPVHPRWGTYDFPLVASALAQDGVNVIAYHRPKGTDPNAYANTLFEQVQTLLSAGVKADQITLVGFSRGGRITAYASNQLRDSAVNIVILAACGDWVASEPEVTLYGHVFSIYETSDAVGSCASLANRGNSATSFKELAISTGKEHGAFYRPHKEWLKPLNDWIIR